MRTAHRKKKNRNRIVLPGLILAAVLMTVLIGKEGVSGEASEISLSRPGNNLPITVEMLDQLVKLPGDLAPLPEVPIPKDNPQSPAKIELGRMLFFDPRLSGNSHWACATCHNPSMAFTDGLPRALGFLEKEVGRHTPSILNTAYNTSQFWDGRVATLEEQARMPILNQEEMNITQEEVEKRLNDIPEYRRRFEEVFGGPATLDHVAWAIASYQRTLVAGGSRFDRYLMGDKQALTDQEKRGLILFISRAACTQCHNGPNLTDNLFHNVGTKHVGPLKMDLGRMNITHDPKDMHAFKTPSLRNVALTPPYMHDGVLKSLEEVVEFYNKGGEDLPNKSPKIFMLNLTEQEKADLVVFLEALTGSLPEITVPRLPLGD
jgi:cytochrome c peroxidase